MYRLLIETLLGVHIEGDQLRLTPLFPKEWNSFKVHYRYRQTVYHITLTQRAEGEPPERLLDGNRLDSETVPLKDDRKEHFVDWNVAPPDSLKKNNDPRARSCYIDPSQMESRK